jgi:hypothetical protein
MLLRFLLIGWCSTRLWFQRWSRCCYRWSNCKQSCKGSCRTPYPEIWVRWRCFRRFRSKGRGCYTDYNRNTFS